MTWSGSTRAALTDQAVYPPLESGGLRTWVAVGGTRMVVRAGTRLPCAIWRSDELSYVELTTPPVGHRAGRVTCTC